MLFTYFITGANRGIGLALVKELVKKSDVKIVATARNPETATELNDIAKSTGKVSVIALDVESDESISKLDSQLSKVASDGVDFFIGNAGYANPPSLTLETPLDAWLKCYRINALGQILTFKALYPYLLKKSTKKVVFVSSEVGSLTQFLPASWSSYGQSKAALNYSMLQLNYELKDKGFTIISCSPGLVDTDLIRKDAEAFLKLNPQLKAMQSNWIATPEFSAKSQVENVYDKLTHDKSGKFFSRNGDEAAF